VGYILSPLRGWTLEQSGTPSGGAFASVGRYEITCNTLVDGGDRGVSLAESVRAADDVPAGDGPLAALAPLIGGEWHFEGKWANGEPLKAREVFEWGLGKKFVNTRTWVTNNNGDEYERYRSTFAVKDGKPVMYNFAYDGESSVDEVKVTGKVIDVRRSARTPAGEMVIRQEIELTEKDKFRWRVWLDRDGESQQIIDGEWVRKTGAKED
jgi:hypothetical protein